MRLKPFGFSERVMPDLSDEEYEALKADIKKNGIRHPIDVSPDGDILDGHHRWRIAKELDIEIPTQIIDVKTDEEKKEWVINSNLLRRQLSTKERYLLYAELSKLYEKGRGGDRRSEEFQKSQSATSERNDVLSRTAEITGTSKDTIARARKYSRIIDEKPDLGDEDPTTAIQSYEREKERKEREPPEPVSIDKGELPVNRVLCGDSLDLMEELPENSVDALVTDPPYGIGFMGKKWDEFREKHGDKGRIYQRWTQEWASKALRVLKPGAYALIFGIPKMHHRMMAGIEDAGFEIRDTLMWIFGSGFPKSLDISKAIDGYFGEERKREKRFVGNIKGASLHHKDDNKRTYEMVQTNEPVTEEAKKWNGWGTALKPAHEPIVLAQKPPEGSYAENVMKWGVGGLNIDGSRVGMSEEDAEKHKHNWKPNSDYPANETVYEYGSEKLSTHQNKRGRWPANVILDPKSAEMLDEQSGERKSASAKYGVKNGKTSFWRTGKKGIKHEATGDYLGGASRFFYCAKAHKSERNAGLEDLEKKERLDNISMRGWQKERGRNPDEYEGFQNDIATLKPINLMRYLVRLVTPPDGTVLDLFAGSGTTGCACEIEGFDYILIEKRKRFAEVIAPKRIEYWSKEENWSELKDHVELPDEKELKHRTLERFT